MSKIFFIDINPKEVKYLPSEDYKSFVRSEICPAGIAGCPSRVAPAWWTEEGHLLEDNDYYQSLMHFLRDLKELNKVSEEFIKNHPLYKFEFDMGFNKTANRNFNETPPKIRKRQMSSRWGTADCLGFEEFIALKVYGFMDLYESIKNIGYLNAPPDPETDEINLASSNPMNFGPINVSIGRDRTFLQNNGLHRLTICQFLDIDKIPVKILTIQKDKYDRERLHITECPIP